MSLSILYRNESDAPELGEKAFDRQMLYDLSIDRAMMTVCMDVVKREKFLGILSRPLTSAESVVYRQQVLDEFITHPALFDEIRNFFEKYRSIKTRWDEERSKSFTIKRLNNSDKNAEVYTNSVALQVTARYTKIILSYIRTLYDLMSNYELKSEGLLRIRNYCMNIVRSDAYFGLEKLADQCESEMIESPYYDVSIEFDSDMKLKTCSFASLNEFKEIDNKKKPGFFGLRKKEAAEPEYADTTQISPLDFDPITDLCITAFNGLDHSLTCVIKRIYIELYGIVSELAFYEVAKLYCERMKNRGADLCFPKICGADENVLYCEGLKDVMLVCESINPANVIPNDVSINGKIDGMLIRGENNSGKTVYLRSVGTALIFAQAGLMISAKNAEISLRSAIFTHFASAEETGGSASAGRFEQEVKVVADIIENFTPNSLILLNETFQTTSYDEGADGIFHILNYIRSLGGGFIFVTHLHALFDLYANDEEVCFKRMSTGDEPQYKIIDLK